MHVNIIKEKTVNNLHAFVFPLTGTVIRWTDFKLNIVAQKSNEKALNKNRDKHY